MKILLQFVSALALGSTILPAILFLGGRVELDQVKWLMLIATVVWFVVTPLWMGRLQETKEEAVNP